MRGVINLFNLMMSFGSIMSAKLIILLQSILVRQLSLGPV
jgi:hypothetical protein